MASPIQPFVVAIYSQVWDVFPRLVAATGATLTCKNRKGRIRHGVNVGNCSGLDDVYGLAKTAGVGAWGKSNVCRSMVHHWTQQMGERKHASYMLCMAGRGRVDMLYQQRQARRRAAGLAGRDVQKLQLTTWAQVW